MWDIRTTDLWIFQLNSVRTPIKAWNILSPGVGSNQGLQASQPPVRIPYSSTDNVRVDIRLKCFMNSSLLDPLGLLSFPIRTEAQTVAVANPAGHQGLVIITSPQDFRLNDEHVYSHWFPMWNEDVDLRIWVRRQGDWLSGCDWNCPDSISAPPWNEPPSVGRVELYDFAGSRRHLTRIYSGGAQTYTVTVVVKDQNTGVPLNLATVDLT